MGHYIEALIINKLVDDFQSPNSLSSSAKELNHDNKVSL